MFSLAEIFFLYYGKGIFLEVNVLIDQPIRIKEIILRTTAVIEISTSKDRVKTWPIFEVAIHLNLAKDNPVKLVHQLTPTLYVDPLIQIYLLAIQIKWH